MMQPREDSPRNSLKALVRDLLQQATGLAPALLHDTAAFHEIGLTSLAILNFNELIQPVFPGLNKTLLFDCRTLHDVVEHLLREHPEASAAWLDAHAQDRMLQEPPSTPAPVEAPWPHLAPLALRRPDSDAMDIAIVGLHGRFPDADNLDQLWQNLLQGLDSISEIPGERWPLEGFFQAGADARNSGLSYAKWGGFLNDIDHFDAQFFAIPPREAACLDPQERLFLQCAWHALEDSGHLGERSQLLRHANGSLDIGVFVGITSNTWPLLGPALWQAGQTAIPSGLPWSVANRVSWALDLCGPSLAVDTACSSSLTALHMALESLRKGQCRAALVGGVNLYSHPAKYVQLCQQHMLSPSGRCHAFGSAADGFVPGEGVAALLLKPLHAARQDGDRILAVIKGSAINHGGRTNGYTVPSASSQAALIEQALADARVTPASISYIEAHGTGTRLGDPIELQGLKQALADSTADTCHVGSVKSNFGHLEAAAGMASLCKVILQMQHRQLVPSLHAQTLNPDAGLEHSRLRIVRERREWNSDGLRRAGISSFGAGGANAHVIVEQAPDSLGHEVSAGLPLFLLSARSDGQLREQARALLTWLTPLGDEVLGALAYTLQCCRVTFDHRFALVAGSAQHLRDGLQRFVQGQASGHHGRVLAGAAAQTHHHSQAPDELARAWVAGAFDGWSRFWERPPVPLATPLYPFARDLHTLPRSAPALAPAHAHSEITLDPQRFFLRDHQVQRQPVLPAAAYIDFCIDQARSQGFDLPLELRALTWASPVRFSDHTPRTLECRPQRTGDSLHLSFKAQDETDRTPNFRGECRPLQQPAAATADLARVRRECTQALDLSTLYPTLERLGIAYGPSFQCLHGAWLGEGQALTEVRLQPRHGEPLSSLDPALLDAVLQSAFVSARGNTQIDSTFVPYACQSLRCHAALSERLFVQVLPQPAQNGPTRTYDFRVFAESGALLLEIDGFAFRQYRLADEHPVQLLQPVWHSASTPAPAPALTTLLYRRTAHAALPAAVLDSAWHLLAASDFHYIAPRTVQANLHDPRHIELLLRLLASQNLAPQCLLLDLRGAPDNTSDRTSGNTGEARSDGLDAVLDASELLRQMCQALGTPRLQVRVLVDDDLSSAIEGLLRSVVQELPSLSASLIEVEAGAGAGALEQELQAAVQPGVQRIRLGAGQRQRASLAFIPANVRGPTIDFAPGDTLLISGGLGAVGRALAATLAKLGGLNLAILGRRDADADSEHWLQQLRQLGAANAGYWQADCADAASLDAALRAIRQRFGACHGVIHCAGVLQDGYFLRQPASELHRVLAGKTLAAQHLDQATASDPLKLFMVCSSLAGVYGNVGQSAYALANAWLDRFVERRQQRGGAGRSLSIAWPLWQTEHGMQAPQPVRQWLARHGLSLLPEDQGVDVFLRCLTLPQAVLVPVCGQREAVAALFGIGGETAPDEAVAESTAAVAAPLDAATPSLLEYLSRQLAEVTATPVERIDPDTSLEVFGLDSIVVMELNGRLEQHFPDLSKTVLFEVRSLRELATLLASEHPQQAARLSPAPTPAPAPDTPVAVTPAPQPQPVADAPAQRQDIAIIGLAGRYPGARDPQALWQHLAAGDDLVSEISPRWPQADGGDELYARWGGLLEDFDCFDPLFFGISPRDAERMDPQERLFLQTAWHAVEDAGYTPQSLSGPRLPGVPRRRVAVIAGVMYGEYQFYGASAWPHKPQTLTNSSYASIANRVSFCLDLEGPSFAVDSMCSSSLTSLHLACDLIRSGSCELALAGGVNLSLHPYKYRTLCELNFASTQGQCRSFGADGDGYVPGEGVGVVLLKPLADALRDGDHIHGVIRGSDLNHGGRTSGYTVPNADAQAQVIARALQRSGLPANRLGYIEAHGTGTSLGDPIEIRGLAKALATEAAPGWQCPIGSIKANLGHLESAAGMAALTKVLLQFKHRQLAPSIHASPLNPHIDFARTPFVVQQHLAPWPAPADGLPRVAAISSFGAGGANAHLLVEDATPQALPAVSGAAVFVFSARGRQQLRDYLQRFVDHLEHERVLAPQQPAARLGREGFTSAEVARTLREGRQRFEEARLAVIADDFDQLRQLLGAWLLDAGDDETRTLLGQGELRDEAQAWLDGANIEPASGPTRKVPLPGYAFLRRRYWIETAPLPVGASSLAKDRPAVPKPLTPQDILDRLARQEITQEQARSLLKALL
ncbi:MAG: SDR family NAD(P)-dependent oxidoreductase [Pseudomonas sp.]|uniref:SDR family NAD(P)-dependent oxidoreductase n=1 Tax=Pseudomonas sp. TaxID=306 RepID=UPI003D0E16CC